MNDFKIGLIDADLIGRKNHRFPNLALMKLSTYAGGGDLILDYDNISKYDKVYVSKVFTDTPFPKEILNYNNIEYGGTGFYFDKAPNLPYEAEHSMPDYHLYDEWLQDKPDTTAYKEYRDYSIGFTTRGCFRKCKFCVNQKYDCAVKHSPLEEFLDKDRKKICLLDDNILSYKHWRDIWEQLINADKPFKFKQGLDERLLTDKKCSVIFSCRYDGPYTFAFDNPEDYDLIKQKLELIRKYTTSTNITFYVLCGYKGTDINDILNIFKRVELLMNYGCVPYIMRYQSPTETPYMNSEYREAYIAIARWCNQPSHFKKSTFEEFCELNQSYIKTEGYICSAMRGLNSIRGKIPEKYLTMRWRYI